jgi:hypothetical protein
MKHVTQGITSVPVASDAIDDGSLEYLQERYIEILGLDEPEDYEPSERDYDYLDA